MKGLIIAGLILANFILQTIILPSFQIFGVSPDTLLCLVVGLGFTNGYFTAAFSGLFGGLMLDILYGWPLGANALIYLLAGVLAGVIREKMRVENFVYAAGFTVGICFIKQIAGIIVGYIAGVKMSFFTALLLGALPISLLTGLFMFPIYLFIRKVSKTTIMRRRYQETFD